MMDPGGMPDKPYIGNALLSNLLDEPNLSHQLPTREETNEHQAHVSSVVSLKCLS